MMVKRPPTFVFQDCQGSCANNPSTIMSKTRIHNKENGLSKPERNLQYILDVQLLRLPVF